MVKIGLQVLQWCRSVYLFFKGVVMVKISLLETAKEIIGLTLLAPPSDVDYGTKQSPSNKWSTRHNTWNL
ncbi:hypothetical protein AB205_0170660 [Aquarana catesbeiana]|uniref:Uncharacterized protein n=1 Tax=Aquarana catesbeiana TaxID=8400 RepID=A0A2G9QM25_AQUCT|nr:hypothetical protein AB205_0170660 [Aquarana catesbeiana]